MYGTNDPNINKLFISNWTDTVFSVEVRVSDFSVIDISPMDLEELILEKDAYITDNTVLFALSVVDYIQTTVG